MAAGRVTGSTTISDHTAEKINKLAEKFFSDPENMKKFETWHMQNYGRLPNGGEKSAKYAT